MSCGRWAACSATGSGAKESASDCGPPPPPSPKPQTHLHNTTSNSEHSLLSLFIFLLYCIMFSITSPYLFFFYCLCLYLFLSLCCCNSWIFPQGISKDIDYVCLILRKKPKRINSNRVFYIWTETVAPCSVYRGSKTHCEHLTCDICLQCLHHNIAVHVTIVTRVLTHPLATVKCPHSGLICTFDRMRM